MGQFGSLADEYENNNNDHTAWLATNVKVTDGLTLFGQAVLSEASSSFSNLFLDDSSLPGIPPGFDYASISELGNFSHLRMRMWHLEGGLRHMFSQSYALDYSLTYSDFNDYQRYLVDSTGSRFGMLFRVNWIF